MNKCDFDAMQEERPFTPSSRIIYEIMRDEIINVKLVPGTKLNEAQIAKKLEISRSPVKTALDMLINEGLLIKASKSKGPVVAPVDTTDCLLICRARICVEGAAAFYAAKSISDEQLAELDDLRLSYQRVLQQEKNVLKAVHIDYRFHTGIVESCGNRYIIDMYRCIESRVLRYRCYLQHLKGPEAARVRLVSRLKCHDAVFSAIANGHSEIAKIEISDDIDAMREMFSM